MTSRFLITILLVCAVLVSGGIHAVNQSDLKREVSMITEPDIYRAFREKELREEAGPDETVKDIMGCPTIVKKGYMALMVTRVKEGLSKAEKEEGK